MALQNLARRVAVSATAALSAVVLTLSLAPAAHAEPTIAEVTNQLLSLSQQNEQLTEQYNQATEDVAAKAKQAEAAKAVAAQALAAYDQSKVDSRATLNNQFRSAGRSQTVAILTSSSSEDYVDQATMLQVIATRRNAVMAALKAAKATADDATATADTLLATATANQKALVAQRTALTAQQDKYKGLLATLTAAQQTQYYATASPTTTEVTTQAAVTAAPAPSGAAAQAVATALAQRGKPYVYAAGGPGSFDCSGLTQFAWRAAGVSLPHNAAAQYGYGTHVSRDQLQPGDLVFFYSPIGHVGIYIGNGLMVHAPTSGDVVKVSPIMSGYVGATRL